MPWKGSMAMRFLVRRSMLTGHLFEEQEKPGKSLIYPFPVVYVLWCLWTHGTQTSGFIVFASVMK